MIKPVSDTVLRILREVRENDPKALQRLRDKCQWEHMSATAVIREWGDPRTWGKKVK